MRWSFSRMRQHVRPHWTGSITQRSRPWTGQRVNEITGFSPTLIMTATPTVFHFTNWYVVMLPAIHKHSIIHTALKFLLQKWDRLDLFCWVFPFKVVSLKQQVLSLIVLHLCHHVTMWTQKFCKHCLQLCLWLVFLSLILKAALIWLIDHNQIWPHLPSREDG